MFHEGQHRRNKSDMHGKEVGEVACWNGYGSYWCGGVKAKSFISEVEGGKNVTFKWEGFCMIYFK